MKNTRNASKEAVWRLIILTAIAMAILMALASCNTKKHLVQHNDVTAEATEKQDSTISEAVTHTKDSTVTIEENRDLIKDLELTFEGIITQEDESGLKQTYDGKFTIKQKEEDKGEIKQATKIEEAKKDTNSLQVTTAASHQEADRTQTELDKKTSAQPTAVTIIIIAALIIILIMYAKKRRKEVRYP